jgi:hypothetical protein
MTIRKMLVAIAVLGLASPAASGCRALGFTNRVLWRVPAPDGRVVAVCQEVPEFDGPSFDVRLEQPDGTMVRRLYRVGDGDPCSEMAWSPDGRTLAVLSGHVARIRLVDVASALRSPVPTSDVWPRQVDFSSERDLRLGKNLRFVGAAEVVVTTCSYSLKDTQRTGRMTCTSDESDQRIAVAPIVIGARRTGP